MKIFYHNYKTQQGIPSDNSQSATVSQTLEIFSGLNAETDNFLGIIDNADKSIQFILEAEDKWLVDIPNPPDFINDQQFGTYEECIKIITKIYNENIVVPLHGMKKVDIMNETLDEVL